MVSGDIDAEKHGQSFTMATPTISDANDNAEHANKRQRLSPLDADSANDINKSDKSSLITPPSSVSPETMSLKLTIPQSQLTKGDQRTLANREAAAKRWIPKLQRPFPKRKEITEAYNLKLLRHYPGPASATYVEPNFTKPHIDVSPRVEELLRRFPIVDTSGSNDNATIPSYASIANTTSSQIIFTGKDNVGVRENKATTSLERSRRLAWQCFSSTERDRIDHEREAMMLSGLADDDLVREYRGLQNRLPEWRKDRTGRFATELRWTGEHLRQ
jgi:hypothetical protein